MPAPPAQTPAEPLLASVRELLRQQEQALRAGDADALPALASQLQQALLDLRRAWERTGTSWPRDLLGALSQQAARNQALLQRRQHAVAEALSTLGAGQAGHEGARSRSTYTLAGQVAPGRMGQRSLARA